jgi:hypothetical protein
MSRKTRRILFAVVLFAVFIALLWFTRLVRGPIPLPAEAALRRIERNYLRPAGEIVETIDDGDLTYIGVVTRSDGELYTYFLADSITNVDKGKRQRLARGAWAYRDSAGLPGCSTYPQITHESYYGHFSTTIVTESRYYYLLKQEDGEVVRAELRVTAVTPDGREQSWSLSSVRENPYYFKFAVTRSLNVTNPTWSLYSLLGGYYPYPPEGTVAVAEASFYDENDVLIGTMSYTVYPERGGEENGA